MDFFIMENLEYPQEQIDDKMEGIKWTMTDSEWTQYCQWIEKEWVTVQDQIGTILSEDEIFDNWQG
jgi:hypothetical protein